MDHTEDPLKDANTDQPMLSLEEKALRTPESAYDYARNVLNAPFPDGEALIATDAQWSYNYAGDVLHGPFPAGEALIATSASWSFYYARHVLRAPFPAGEAAIRRDSRYWHAYQAFLETL